MRCCGLESSKSLDCPGNCLSCAHFLLLLLFLLLALLSNGAAPLARSTSYLQIRCLWCCCLSDWVIHAEPFVQRQHTHTDFRVSNPTFTFPHSSPCLHLWMWACSWVSVFVCVYRRGWNLLSHTVNTLHYKNQCTLQLIWKDARVFYSLQPLSKQTPTCPVYPDDYVYGTETMGLHVNP